MDQATPVTVGWLSSATGMDRAQISQLLKARGISMDNSEFPLHLGIRAIIAKYKEKSESAKLSLEEAKQRKVAAEAKLAELDLAKREGELVEVEEVRPVIERMLSMLKQRLEQLPDQAAIQIAGCKSTGDVKEKLTTICHQFLSELHSIEIVKELEKE